MLSQNGRCQRIDLNFRALYPYIRTKLYRVGEYKYQLLLVDFIDNFEELSKEFDRNIRYATAPIKLVQIEPVDYLDKIVGIADDDIPNDFSGLPLTVNQIQLHIESVYSDVRVSNIKDNHEDKVIMVKFEGQVDHGRLSQIKNTVDSLGFVYPFILTTGGDLCNKTLIADHVLNIAPSSHLKSLGCDFVERDEKLWFENVGAIYKGEYKKDDLYFYDENKTSCLVNFSKFQNANLRNHLLLYDVVYCVLPLAKEMSNFLINQKISRNDILGLVKRGRLKILNMQPENRLDYGFINEAFQENPSSIVSRRALSV